jgi:hypothetical protein
MRTLRIVALLGTFSFLALSSDTGGPVVTPEPSLVIVLASGLAGIGVVAWRRNRKK